MTFCITETVCLNFPLSKLNCFEIYTNHGESFILQKQHIKKYHSTFNLAISSLSNICQWNYTGLFVQHSFQKVPHSGTSSLIYTIITAHFSSLTQFQTRLVPGTLRDCFHPSFFLFLTALPNALVSLRRAFVTVSCWISSLSSWIYQCQLHQVHPVLWHHLGVLNQPEKPCHSKRLAIKMSTDLENWRQLKEEGSSTQKPPESKQTTEPPQVCGCVWTGPRKGV